VKHAGWSRSRTAVTEKISLDSRPKLADDIVMLNFTYVNGKLTSVSTSWTRDAINRNDLTNLAHAEEVAQDATALTGRLHIGVDKGDHTWPRYDVIEAPVVGAEVSRAFNGDYYPAGKIVKVSASLRRVQTDQGVVFYRRGQSGQWLEGGTWTMVAGSIERRNPSF
jgi:hypothetical protein